MIKKSAVNRKIGKLFKFKNLNKIKKTNKVKNWKKPCFLIFKARLAFI